MSGDLAAAPTAIPELYKLVQEENWVKVLQRASTDPDEAKYANPTTRLTALHLAVIARKTANPSARIAAIRALLQAYPEAAVLGDEECGYTPLAYACLVVDDSPKVLEDDNQVVKLILEHSPRSFHILSQDGHSSLDLHIMAMSRLRKQSDLNASRRSKKGQKSQAGALVLKTLLEQDHHVGLAKPLDLLFECNSLAVLEQVALEEAQATTSKLRARRLARSSSGTAVSPNASVFSAGSTNFANFWVWEWTLILLRSEHSRKFSNYKPTPPFNAMHAAAQVRDCPLPFLMLAMRAYPNQIRAPDDFTGNLPLHVVAGWDASDPSSVSRKSMALSALVSEYPQATKVRNKQGKTPLSLALETGTTWDSGVRRLTTFQKEGSFAVR